MSLPFPISSTQTDAKSPIDDNLMDSIREDLDYLDGQVTGGIVAGFNWNVTGKIRKLANWKAGVDMIALNAAFTPLTCRAAIRKSGIGNRYGSSGSLAFDIRRITKPKTPIIEIANQYDAITQSVAKIEPNLTTQSIARATAQISTQTITKVKSAINIDSIIQVQGTNKWRINLSSAVDSDWVPYTGSQIPYIEVSGASNSNNNGFFAIEEVDQSGYRSIVVTNASGVAQTAASGSVDLMLFSYNFINPVSTEFAIGETFTAASHTNAANDGTFAIYKINQSGNNIWVFNSGGAVQGSAAGVANCNRWIYTLGSTPDVLDFVVGELANFSGHTNSLNDGYYIILSVNSGGNNIKIFNLVGVAQASPAGTVNTNRFVYALPTDPSSQVSVGDYVRFTGHTSSANDGFFQVKRINRSGNNLVVLNSSGVNQAGIAGTTATTRKLIKFETDQSSVYSTNSYIEIVGCPDSIYNRGDRKSQWRVLQVNRGGGSAYNVVIDAGYGSEQSSPAGYVWLEMKSIFNTKPVLNADYTSIEADGYISGAFSDFVAGVIPSDTPLALFIESMTMSGDPLDLSVHL